MAYSHSFVADFYGDPYAEHKKTRKPKDVCEALFNMPKREWNQMAKDVFGCKPQYLDLDVVLSKIMETDTVANLDTPVEVWIDAEGFHRVLVY